MPLTDLDLDDLQSYRPTLSAPADFDAFWADTLAEARRHDTPVTAELRTDTHLTAFDAYDVRFPGWNGEPVAAWLLLPHATREPLPVIVKYLGYSGGRGLPGEHLLPPAAGYAHLVVDSRGQGHDTPDRGQGDGTQWAEGFLTRGIDHPRNHYYRRLITDCVRALDALPQLPGTDPARAVVSGGSQGGGLALAVAALAPDQVAALLSDVPFLCHFRRAVRTAGDGPYPEIVKYLRWHSRDQEERTFATLDYFDGVHFAPRATAPALFSVALMDPVCPPSTVYAAYHRYAGPAEIEVWQFADHGGGYASTPPKQFAWLAERGLAPKNA
ncbi:alpha/beta fold hydrolase [Streptomyces sp. TLI_171]|uniref:acetylxylan esterase n=1 Tax=Streptomyces sp. TLI_171 TaxID=1938859 RepID=UPI000C18F105|nr:alpha/beta fold hydrolase [Streptomyces sp. TLI_171]RKE17112.1 cephalosporin-C deacetylase [Streptomyces sp. TLI_171]